MERLPHGYTNSTTRQGRVVTKSYNGPDAARRQARETAVLEALHGWLPVPPVISSDGRGLQTGFVSGMHGQDLIDSGMAGQVLRACGRMLRRIHGVGLDVLPADDRRRGRAPGQVLVHGDYGPNNVLLDATASTVVAIVDWEWAHQGDPVEDLAWCEWIVRMHHPQQGGSLGCFFDAYGWRPPWPARHRAMLGQQRTLIDFCQRWDPGSERARLWRDQMAVTSAWTE
jgi:aminoglycoside phosphotransferase (APT) family kinase protein